MQEHEKYYANSRLYPTILGFFQATTALFSKVAKIAGKALVFSTTIPFSLFVLRARDINNYFRIKREENTPNPADHNTIDRFFDAIKGADLILKTPEAAEVQSNESALLTSILKENGVTRSEHEGYASFITKLFNSEYKTKYGIFYKANIENQTPEKIKQNSKLLSLLYKFSVMTLELNTHLMPKYKQRAVGTTSSNGVKLKTRSTIEREGGEALYNIFDSEFENWLQTVVDQRQNYKPVLTLLKNIKAGNSSLKYIGPEQQLDDDLINSISQELEQATVGFISRADKEYDISNISLNAVVYACMTIAGTAPILAMCGVYISPLWLLIGHWSLVISGLSAGFLALKKLLPVAIDACYHVAFNWNEREIHDISCDITLNVLYDFLNNDATNQSEEQDNTPEQQQKFSAADIYKAIRTGITNKLHNLNGITNLIERYNFVTTVKTQMQQIAKKHTEEHTEEHTEKHIQAVYKLLRTISTCSIQDQPEPMVINAREIGEVLRQQIPESQRPEAYRE
jgi:hypothetical protein